MPKINLYEMPTSVMLILGYPTGVSYENQVSGSACATLEFEGLLVPIGYESSDVERIMGLPFPGPNAIGAEIADMIDEILAAEPRGRFLKVDRDRLHESHEAWVYVTGDTPEESDPPLLGPYFGAPRGFGRIRGVLTWPNSD